MRTNIIVIIICLLVALGIGFLIVKTDNSTLPVTNDLEESTSTNVLEESTSTYNWCIYPDNEQ